MTLQNWSKYIKERVGAEPRPLLVRAMEFVTIKDKALDLGAGSLRDSRFLLSLGFEHVIAVDKTAIDGEVLQDFSAEKFSYVVSSFADFNFPENTYDLVNAQYALHLNPKETFAKVFSSISRSLKSGGVFTANLLGNRDQWNIPGSDMSFQTKEEIQELLKDFKIIELTEEDYAGPTASNHVKRWHLFNIIAEKK